MSTLLARISSRIETRTAGTHWIPYRNVIVTADSVDFLLFERSPSSVHPTVQKNRRARRLRIPAIVWWEFRFL
jgi:hypothetical protein